MGCSNKHTKSQTEHKFKSTCQRKLKSYWDAQNGYRLEDTKQLFCFENVPAATQHLVLETTSRKVWTKWKSSIVRQVHSLSSSENYHLTRKESNATDWKTCSMRIVIPQFWACWPVVWQLHWAQWAQITLPALLWMVLSSLEFKDTVKVQKKLKPCSSQLKDDEGDCPGTQKQTRCCHTSTYEPWRALPMKEILKRLLGHDNKLAEGGKQWSPKILSGKIASNIETRTWYLKATKTGRAEKISV